MISAVRVSLVLFSVACGLYTAYFFADAFPITNLSITADRHAVRASARALRSDLDGQALVRPSGDEGWREASSFELDQACQHFVELRGGGNAAFSRVLGEGLYSPFTWRVRHFRPGDAAETHYVFRPDGGLDGFTTTLPEEEAAANLTADAALEVATRAAALPPWRVDMAAWRLVEQQAEAKPRRADHTFTFERAEREGAQAGEGGQASYRLALRVSGDGLSSVRRSFKVPEAFAREFDGLRSANEALAQLAWIGIVVLYGVGGVVGGSWYLLRRKALAAASALPWSLLLGAGMGAAILVQLPHSWMAYSTEVDVRVFGLDFAVKVGVNALFLLAVAYLSLVAAEGLGRRAFPRQLRLWALMRRAALASAEVRGQVLLGYLLVPVMFAYEVTFYFASSRVLGWWMPSSPLADPNVNATLAPWLVCIAQALFAGFWEEALFRAVPLASAALAAPRRAAARGAVLAGAFAVQACVFGAAHANYPAMPAHARLVELLLPSLGFGALYWRCGLLPGVVLHFVYDVVWMALPIFLTSSAAAGGLDKALVLLCAAAPLLAVAAGAALGGSPPAAAKAAAKAAAAAKAGEGPSADPLAAHRNASWAPRAPAEAAKARPQPQPKMPAAHAAGVAAAGGAAAALWLFWLLRVAAPSPHAACARWADAQPPAAQAAALARAALLPSAAGPGARAPPSLGALVAADAAAGAETPAGALRARPRLRSARAAWLQHRFVWAARREAYAPLLAAGFLRGSEWQVRYARVGENASLAASAGAEEWLVSGVAPDGGAARGACAAAFGGAVRHTLPEARPGANMSEAAARDAAHAALSALALRVVAEGGAHDAAGGEAACAAVRESDSRAIAHPNRTDYAFNFTCAGDGFGLRAVGAEARVGVRVGAGAAGPLVLATERFVKVPEEWLRADKTQEKICSVLQLAARVAMILGLGLGAAHGVVAWSAAKGAANAALGRAFRRAALALLLLLGGAAANKTPLWLSELQTSQPFTNQLVSHLGSLVVGLAMQVSLLSLAALSLASPPPSAPPQRDLGRADALRLAAGAAAGAGLCALRAALAATLSDDSHEPRLVDASAWFGFSVPLGLLLSELLHFSMRALLGCLLSRALHAATPAGASRLWLAASPRAWLLCLGGGVLLMAKDLPAGAACAAVDNLPLSAALLGGALLALHLAAFHHHLQLVPVAAAAHQLMDCAALLAHDGSMHSRWAWLSVGAVAAAVVALCTCMCAALAVGAPREKNS